MGFPHKSEERRSPHERRPNQKTQLGGVYDRGAVKMKYIKGSY
jgi:hypothetical protein